MSARTGVSGVRPARETNLCPPLPPGLCHGRLHDPVLHYQIPQELTPQADLTEMIFTTWRSHATMKLQLVSCCCHVSAGKSAVIVCTLYVDQFSNKVPIICRC